MDPFTINPDTLRSDQTTFDGTLPPLKGSGPLQPGQEYAPGYAPNGLPFAEVFQNANAGQISTWFGQLQGWVEENPGLFAVMGLGVLIMAMNSSQGRRR